MRDFRMIADGDRLLVGLSGGKDSWTLLTVLHEMRRKAPVEYDLAALHIHPDTAESDIAPLADHCRSMDIPFTSLDVETDRIIREHKTPGGSACSFCARLRRGAIYRYARDHGFTTVALGHHREDVIETLLLNQFFAGVTKAMAPCRSTDSTPRIIVIRPLVYVPETVIADFCAQRQLPVHAPSCPYLAEEEGERQRIKKWLGELEAHIPDVKSNLLHALRHVEPGHLLDRALRERS